MYTTTLARLTDDQVLALQGNVVPDPAKSPAAIYLASLMAGASRRTMQAKLDRCARLLSCGQSDVFTLQWSALRFHHVVFCRTRFQEQGLAPKTVNVHLTALKGVARNAWRLGLIDAEELARIEDVRQVPGSSTSPGRLVSRAEQVAIFEYLRTKGTVTALRNAAILALGFGAGLRRAEIAGLDLHDYSRARGALFVRGKGNKEREVGLAPGAAAHLHDWLRYRGDFPTGGLITQVTPAGVPLYKRLSADAVTTVIRDLNRRLQLDPPFTPHDMRRSFCTRMLQAGVREMVVQRLMGHSSPKTTARYDISPQRDALEAVQALEVPY